MAKGAGRNGAGTKRARIAALGMFAVRSCRPGPGRGGCRDRSAAEPAGNEGRANRCAEDVRRLFTCPGTGRGRCGLLRARRTQRERTVRESLRWGCSAPVPICPGRGRPGQGCRNRPERRRDESGEGRCSGTVPSRRAAPSCPGLRAGTVLSAGADVYTGGTGALLRRVDSPFPQRSLPVQSGAGTWP